MTRSTFLRLTALGTLGFATRGFALPSGYTGIPAGIRPYLQTPRPDSMWVSWFSDDAPNGQIHWGDSPANLTESIATGLDVLGVGYHYHSGRITGLQPSTYYYYKVNNGSVESEVFRFRTPPPAGTKIGQMRVLVMGDNQIIGENRYEKLIAGCKHKIESTYGKPIEEVIDFILMPGDQVDVGTLDHYRNLHFKQCGLVSPNLPIMTTVGNHETYYDNGLTLYRTIFKYDDIDYAGLPGAEGEAYYAYQLANIAFIHTSSEHTGPVQKQWVRGLVNALKTDSTTDLCVSVVHRPYQAEQYIGDISGWFRSEIMPMLAETDKHVLNIGAHHHLYARGQTREWPIYHIISGGTAWDQYWGQSTEMDYDDVQKTIAHWAWQLMDFDLADRTMEVTCYAEANVRLPAATRWNYNSRLIDQFHRRLGLAAPQQPSLGNTFDGPVTLPLELVGSAFQTMTDETLNSTWFQVATDGTFSNCKIDKIRDWENLFGDTGAPLFEPVDIHAEVDILRYHIVAGLANGEYHARVRHRDTNAMWSQWSVPIVFEVEGSITIEASIALAKSVFAPGEDIVVSYEGGPGLPTDWIGIYGKGKTPGPNPATIWHYVHGTNGTRNFVNTLPVGEWFVGFFTEDGYTEIAPRVPFYVGSLVELTPAELTHELGDTVRIDFAGAPGGARDWIGIFRVGMIPGQGTSVEWAYAVGVSGQLEFNGLAAGYYYAAFMVNDGYQEIAERVRFSVGSEITAVSMGHDHIEPGKFTVRFENGPGIPKDYLGIFKQGETPGIDVLTAYLYFDGKTSGEVTFDLPDLSPGDYFVAMYTNDSYTQVSNRALFTVTKPLKLEQSRLDGDQMFLRWTTQPGQTYRVQRCSDLHSWEDAAIVVATGAFHEIHVPVAPALVPKEFFRVVRN